MNSKISNKKYYTNYLKTFLWDISACTEKFIKKNNSG